MDERVFHNVVDDGAKTEFICNRNNDKCRALFFSSLSKMNIHMKQVLLRILCVSALDIRVYFIYLIALH